MGIKHRNVAYAFIKLFSALSDSVHRDITTSRHHYIATSLHRYIATSLHRYIATSLHRYIATSLHRYIANQFSYHIWDNLKMKMLALLGIFIFSISAHAINGRTTYQAKIIKPDGYPLEATSVNFRFSVLDPAASCVLYIEEYAAINMNSSGGLISFALGNAASVTFPSSQTATTFQEVFDNSRPFISCQSAGSYMPNATDSRKIVMQFNDGNGWQTLPAMTINAVPYAMYATRANNSLTLNGKQDTAFVEKATLAALNCTATQAIKFNNATFSCIDVPASGSGGITSVTTSGSVLSTGGTASAPVISIQAATLSQDGYLTSLDYAEFKAKLSASSTQIINTLGYAPVSGAAVTTQINNSNLSGDVSGTVSANSVVSVGGKTSTQVATSVDDTLAATSSATADTIVKRNSSGNATFNDLYASAAKINYVDIYKPSTSFNIRLQAPTSLSTNYVLNLPTTSGTTGQVLSTDGSGNLSWINPSTGSVTSVSATAPLASTGGATPIISITQATSSTDGYLSSADWNTFNNKLSVTSAATTYVQKAGDTMTGSLNLPSNGLTVGSSQLVVSGSNVGIGVVNPFFKLTVSSPTNTWGLLQTDGAVQVGSWIGSDISGQMGGWYGTRSNHPLMFFTNNGWAQMTLTPSGNVGIGTVLATAKLHLTSGSTTVAPLKFTSGALLTSPQSGTMEYDGTNFYLTDSANTRRTIATGSSSNSIDNASTINSTSDITLNPNNGANSVIVSSTVASTSSNNGALVVKGGLGVAGTANIAGNMNVSGSSVIDGSLKLSSMTSGSVLFAGTGGTVTQDNANFFWDDVNNRLGIGTVSPADKLEVFGGALRSSRNSSQYIYLYGGDGVNQQTYLRSVSQESNKKLTVFQSFHDGAGSSAGTLGFQFQIGTSTTASTTMVIAENGYVGIGTSTPGYVLDVFGNGARVRSPAVTNNALFLDSTSATGPGAISTIYLQTGGVTQSYIQSQQNNKLLEFGTSNTTRMVVDGSGNVGIGTLSPGAALQVGGSASLGDIILKAGSGLPNDAGDLIFQNNSGIQLGRVWSDTSTSGLILTGRSTNISDLYLSASGTIGIGTTNPGYKLDVSGTINIASGSALAFGGTSVCTAAGCTSSSDERLKENIKPLDFDLNKLLSLNAVQYDWKNKAKYGDKHQIGFIAQNLEKVYPEVVYTDKTTGLKSVTYGHLVAPVIEALKSLYKRIVGVEEHNVAQDRQIASIVESKADKAEIEVLKQKAAEVDDLKAENAAKAKEIDALKSYLCSKDPAAPICK